MGEGQCNIFEPTFNRSFKVQTTDARLTSDAGVVLLREAEHRLGLIESIASKISDPRNPSYIRYGMDELLRERVYAMALGYSAQDDVDRLAHDRAFRAAVCIFLTNITKKTKSLCCSGCSQRADANRTVCTYI